MATAAALVAIPAPAAQAAPFVYVTSNGVPGNVFQFDAGPGGLLAPLDPPSVAADQRPTEAEVSPDGRTLYVANSGAYEDGDPGGPDFGDTISQYDIGADGSLSPKSPAAVAAGDLPTDIAVSPDGENAYVTNAVSEEVLQYEIGPGGRLSLSSSAPAPVDWGEAVAVSPDGSSVYVVAGSDTVFGGDHTIYQYDVAPGGELSPKSPPTVDAGVIPSGLAVSPDGKSVYVVNCCYQNSPISQYDVEASGKLLPKNPPTVAAGEFPGSIAVSPDGKSAYVTSRISGGERRVLQYDVGPGGALVPKSPPGVGAGGRSDSATDLAVSADGESVYVATVNTDGSSTRRGGVFQFDVGAGGELSPKDPATVAAEPEALGVAVSPQTPVPTTKKQCRHGGWREFGFESKRKCIRFVKRQARRACHDERDALGRQAFREKYGRGEHHRCAMRRCVRQAIGPG